MGMAKLKNGLCFANTADAQDIGVYASKRPAD